MIDGKAAGWVANGTIDMRCRCGVNRKSMLYGDEYHRSNSCSSTTLPCRLTTCFMAEDCSREAVKPPRRTLAVVSSRRNKRIPFQHNLKLTQWYAHTVVEKGAWRVTQPQLTEATVCLMPFDAPGYISSVELAKPRG
jgi:hypothetical protein